MRGRWIRGNASTRTPGNTVVIHAEGERLDPGPYPPAVTRLRGATVRHWRSRRGTDQPYREWDCVTGEDVWRLVALLLDSHRPTWVWCWDVGRTMSLTSGWTLWERGILVPRSYHLGDSAQYISGAIRGRRVVLIDARNWIDGRRQTIPPSDSAIDWLSDSVRAIYRLVRDDDLGCLRYTAAAQAMQSWRHRWMEYPVLIPSHPLEPGIAESCHYGGRSELFFRGRVRAPGANPGMFAGLAAVHHDGSLRGPVHVLDVSGLYGWCESQHQLPCQHLDVGRDVSPDRLLALLDGYGVCARVLVDTDRPLPYRDQERGTIHPTGRYWTSLCGPELQRALDARAVVQCSHAATYRLAPILRAAAQWWWDRRQRAKREGDGIVEGIAKSMPCALYGRWAMRAHQWEDYPAGHPQIDWGYCTTDHPEHGEHCHAQVIAGDMRVRTHWLASEFYFPAISAYIAGYARDRIDEMRGACEWRSVYAQVCDALHVSARGRDCLVSQGYTRDGQWGDLRDVHTYSDVHYYAPTCIRADGVLHCAGLPPGAVETSEGEYGVVTTERIVSLLSRAPDGTVRSRAGTWRPSYVYRSSVVGADGWCRPHVIQGEGDASG